MSRSSPDKYPPISLSEVEKQNADKLLRGVDNMIVDLVRRIMPSRTPDADLDDIAQDVRLFAVGKIIPSYDPAKGTKFSTYAHLCISRFLIDQRRRWLRQRQNANAQLFDVVDLRDTSEDRKVESTAAAIRSFRQPPLAVELSGGMGKRSNWTKRNPA